MKSMTGYGSGGSVSKGIKILVELSSVNRRQAEVAVSVPGELESLESDIRKAIFSSVSRGRVSGRVSIQRPTGSANRSVIINNDQAEVYKKALSKFADGMSIDGDLSLETLLRFPGVMETIEKTVNPATMLPVLKKAMSQALKQLQQMRAKEGQHLGKDLAKRLSKLRIITKKISKRAPKVLVMHRKRLLERLSKSEIDLQDVNDERFLREIVYFTDRSDITEELIRLESHFKQMHSCLTAGEPVGRKLDFLAQEMFREVNTIGSKANDSIISKEVVALKTELEKIREQVQNVE
ncbi:MAG: YicC/YloC family endoribonuclease [Verrucomicrobiota bacterium]|nr:YicC/YloC family endoribonuclease [Verrucomicrobiota bacterium]